MARKALSIDERIEKQKEVVAAAQEKYDAAVKELENLEKTREEQRNQQLINVASTSGKSYDEIMAFLKS